MNFSIRVVPGASRKLVKEEEGFLKVYLTRPAQDGQANTQLLEVLAEHLKVKKYQLAIVRGKSSRNKVISVNA
ncbi:MAG: DUF167 domain-containing protein [Candidatus Omnitrophica bacterium]|nr:DUF167 domain-containing protein [Candidatus Omnitrophota bacterium]